MDCATIMPQAAPPDDAEALAAARAEFWARWRGELPSYAATRRKAAQASSCAGPKSASVLSMQCRNEAGKLVARVDRLVEKELARCEASMTGSAWHKHREWVEEHARGCLWEVLSSLATKGKL
jgi:hypothetical protein